MKFSIRVVDIGWSGEVTIPVPDIVVKLEVSIDGGPYVELGPEMIIGGHYDLDSQDFLDIYKRGAVQV